MRRRAHRHLVDVDRLLPCAADAVAHDLGHRGVRGDPLHSTHDRAALHHAHPHVHVERDVDPLAEPGAEHVDRAVANDDACCSDVDAVELRALHGHVVEDRAVDAVHGDPVRPPEHGEVADLDVVVRYDDPAADHRARLTLQDLALPDHERSLVYAGGERHDRREAHVPRRGGADEGEQDRCGSGRADAAELSAVLCVTEPKQREAGLSEDERRKPACSEECERRYQRRVQAEAVDDRQQRGELDRSERHRSPGGLVREQPVPDLEIEE